jgi:tetratricopeptide (TPR) repeat protein
MPSPTPSEPTAETGFDPAVFWLQHKKTIVVLIALFVVAIVAYGTWEHMRSVREGEAVQMLAGAKTPDDYRKVIASYEGTPPAADALLLLAEKQRAEGKYDESSATLHQLIDKYPDYPLLSGAWTSLAANLEAQGKTDEALSTYQKVSSAYANSFSAPLALLSQARLLGQKGKTEEARKLYEQVMAQYRDNYVSQQASQELSKLKK